MPSGVPAVQPATDAKHGFAVGGEVRVAHGVAIDGGIVKGRQVAQRKAIRRRDPAIRTGERNRFDTGRDGQALGHQRDGLFDRHRRRADGKAVVAKLDHRSLTVRAG
jgi:hypothetical protein